MNNKTRFIVFCIENYKMHHNLSGKKVYELFQKYDVLSYLTEGYECLHTTGDQYINRDIDDYLSVRGVQISALNN